MASQAPLPPDAEKTQTETAQSFLALPRIGLGMFELKDSRAAFEAVLEALRCGYRLVDTARMYRNEEAVGRAVRAAESAQVCARGDVFVTTKIPPHEQGFDTAYQAVLDSLARLQMDYVDLVLIHWPGARGVPHSSSENQKLRQGSWDALARLQGEGKVRFIGVSNFQVAHLEALRGPLPAVNQVELHPFLTQTALREYCEGKGILVQAYSSLGRASPALWEHPVVQELCKESGLSAPSVLLLWAMQQGIYVIPKASSEDRIRANFDAFRLLNDDSGPPLSQDQLARLSALHCDEHYCWNPAKVTG